jgi:hypothetical protein
MEFTRNNFGRLQPALTIQDILRAIEHHKPVTRQYIRPKEQEQLLGRFYNSGIDLPMNDQNKFDMNTYGLFDGSDFTHLWHFVHTGIFHLKSDNEANRFLLDPTEPLGLAVGLVTKFKSLLTSDVDITAMNKESEVISNNEVRDMYDDVELYNSTNENIKFGSADHELEANNNLAVCWS